MTQVDGKRNYATTFSVDRPPREAYPKAAALSLTQAQRALFADQGVRVHAVLTGPTDTDMSRELDAPKASPESVARAIFDGVENQEEDIFPDPNHRYATAIHPQQQGDPG